MPRPEKVQAVADIKERLDGAQAVFLAEYAGLSVQEQQALRRELRANGAEFKVVKMTLARLASADLEIEDFDALLLGPTGLTFADGDPVGAAKVLRDFARTHEVLVVKGGLLGREFLTPERIAELADIEPREVLLAKIAGAFEAPMAKMAGLLAALPRNAATAMHQLLEKKQAESPELPAASDEPEVEPDSAGADVEDADVEDAVAEDAVAEEAAVEVAEAEEAVVEEAVLEEAVEEAAEEAVVAEAEEAVVEEVAAEEAVVEEAAEAEAELEVASPDEESDEREAQSTESDDEAPAADVSEEDAGTEPKDTDDAADDAVEEE
ncbi:MAG: 50S ribosomal protein L10 [Acidimicrobiia bacterium]